MLQLDFMVALIFDFLVQIKKNVKEHPIIIRVQFGFYQVYVFQEIPFLHFPYGSMLNTLSRHNYQHRVTNGKKSHILKNTTPELFTLYHISCNCVILEQYGFESRPIRLNYRPWLNLDHKMRSTKGTKFACI